MRASLLFTAGASPGLRVMEGLITRLGPRFLRPTPRPSPGPFVFKFVTRSRHVGPSSGTPRRVAGVTIRARRLTLRGDDDDAVDDAFRVWNAPHDGVAEHATHAMNRGDGRRVQKELVRFFIWR